MIETENESLRERVCDLEKKVLEQGDEIVCLRSTLADVLRRLNQLEGSRTLSLNTSVLKNGNTPRAAGTFVINCCQFFTVIDGFKSSQVLLEKA